MLLVVKCDDLLPVGASGRQPRTHQLASVSAVPISHDRQPVTHHRHAGATRHAPRRCIPPRSGADSLRRHSRAGPPVRRAWPRRSLAVGQAGQRVSSTSAPVPCVAPRQAVPTPINRTASAATRAGLPRTAVTARTTPSRRSLLHLPQTCRGGGMGAEQVVRRRQRLGSMPRRKQRMSGHRHRVIAKPGQGVDSPPVVDQSPRRGTDPRRHDPKRSTTLAPTSESDTPRGSETRS